MQIQFSLSWLLLLRFLIFSQQSQPVHPLDILEDGVVAFVHIANETVTKVRTNVNEINNDLGEFDYAKKLENQIKVLQHFKNIARKINQIEKNHVTISKHPLYDYLFKSATQMDKIGNMVDDMEAISEEFANFEKMAISENETLITSFTEEITRSNSLKFLNNDFYLKLYGQRYISKEILSQLRQKYEISSEKRCHSSQTPQQLVYSLYKDIALTELKAYILIEYSLLIRRVSGPGNFNTETNLVRNNYNNINEEALDTLINTMKKADRVLWRCDPENHVQGVTYEELTRLLQGYVENEVDLNSDGSCSQSCPDYTNTTKMGCFDQKFCSQQPSCSGRIHDCQFIESDLSVCQSPESSNRRYDYIQYSNGPRFGEREKCWRDVNNVESWRRLFYKCSYCFCLCDEPGPRSDRYFNLRPVVSDVWDNKVVTGVRFVKKNRIIHLQIQQGQLLPRGAINESTVEWKPIDDYKIDDFNVTEGVDYHAMSYENRRIHLHDITHKYRTYVVNGVSLDVFYGRLSLRVSHGAYWFAKGELNTYNLITDKEFLTDLVASRLSFFEYVPEKLNIDNLDVPTRSIHSSEPLSKKKQYIEFVNTGIEKDAAQTTIPFLDMQEVASNPPVPLFGIGLYYKGSPGYGGFIAPRIISYDIADYVRLPSPEL
ncbi:uncharacterized protein LOC133838489 [Drosophila sulfurigaster albostrigata]|uniref:uncharacterized protein LOC133838489 n=1 Tax=Drosophila sulfurigaster albostrigata TaxID=89887 RepID=UPI002D21CED3|nr:uncharacterized protein LOC133838489 [Drosophila sulfurigaster albostrigata]